MAWIGKWLFGVGVIHLSFGLAFKRGTLAFLLSEGLWNTVNGQPQREQVFWFLCSGIMLLIVGVLFNQAERSNSSIPPCVTWTFVGLVVVGVIVMPISGIWLLFPPVAGMVIRGQKATKERGEK